MALLGVNVDHVATVREARQTNEPDPVWAAVEAELGGADLITVHLREDRRHIRDRDLHILSDTVAVPLNLEMSMNEEIVSIALQVRPDMVTLVPEKRQEVTTEGGLDVEGQLDRVRQVVQRFSKSEIPVSLFIDPDKPQIEAASRAKSQFIELHTGRYAEAGTEQKKQTCVAELANAAEKAIDMDMVVNAGHGLTYRNVNRVVQAVEPYELHIGHSIVARAMFVGIRQAVAQMKDTIEKAEAI
jgi:pyridoxine 5-phosphate synthase